MSRFGIAFLFLALATTAAVAVDDRIASTLAVQNALQQGRMHLLKGDYQAAVLVLEGQIARVDGNRAYLETLRDAYRGLVKTLHLAGKEEDAKVYERRLAILDPGAPLDFAPKPETPAPKPAVREPIARAKLDTPPLKPAPPATPTLDPFSEANARKAHEARALVEQAEQLFVAEKYAQAGELYDQAYELYPEALREAGERRAYCRMSLVVERLNRHDRPIASEEWTGLERQVRQAMSMTPKLEPFGNTLLATIGDRRMAKNERKPSTEAPTAPAAPEVQVKHSRATGGRYALAETANFRVFHNLDEAKAEQIARIAESARAAAQKKWFGRVLEDWAPKCDLYIHPTADVYSAETGKPGTVPGHATIGTQGDRVVQRRLDMRLDHPEMLQRVLPHEATHVVLAGMFGPKPLPRWADEGMAVLTEPRRAVEMHLKNLPAHRSAGQLFQSQDLIESRDYPAPHLVGAFYAQSVSLVDYLSGLQGPETFAKAVRDAQSGGMEAALQKYYGIQGFADLHARWMAHAFGTRGEGMAKRSE